MDGLLLKPRLTVEIKATRRIALISIQEFFAIARMSDVIFKSLLPTTSFVNVKTCWTASHCRRCDWNGLC